jgi:hypothetical protein
MSEEEWKSIYRKETQALGFKISTYKGTRLNWDLICSVHETTESLGHQILFKYFQILKHMQEPTVLLLKKQTNEYRDLHQD